MTNKSRFKNKKSLLPGARLIIGNGFDLQCGLHSSYIDYFNYKENDYLWFQKTLNLLFNNQFYYKIYNINDFPKEIPSNLSIWDLLFWLLSKKKTLITNWFDVEYFIKLSLFSEDDSVVFSFYKFAKSIKNIINNKTYEGVLFEESHFFLLKHFLMTKVEENVIFDEKSFYSYLKSELIKFETSFAKYLSEDLDRIDYNNLANNLLKKIIGEDKYNITEIDSFNYTNFIYNNVDFFNINGNKNSPIFGVDSSEIGDYKDDRKIFTKQYRRLEQILIFSSRQSVCSDDCIYFYGHSLNEQDYDFFFALFDSIDLLNNFDRKFVFVYSIYNENRKRKIEKDYVDAIYSLYFAYEKSKGILNPRIVTQLIRHGKIEIKAI